MSHLKLLFLYNYTLMPLHPLGSADHLVTNDLPKNGLAKLLTFPLKKSCFIRDLTYRHSLLSWGHKWQRNFFLFLCDNKTAVDIIMLAYRTTTGSAPSYFPSLLRIYIPSRSLISASERRLVVPSQRGSKSLSRTFSFTVPGRWNDLPTPIRNAGSLSIFKQQLKTHLFQHYLTSP